MQIPFLNINTKGKIKTKKPNLEMVKNVGVALPAQRAQDDAPLLGCLKNDDKVI